MTTVGFSTLLCIVLMLATGCTEVSSVDQVFGRYVLQISEAIIELELRTDMTYVETIRFKSGQTVEAKGRWKWVNIAEEWNVEMYDFAVVHETLEPGKIEHREVHFATYRRFGRMSLFVNEDLGLYFERRD